MDKKEKIRIIEQVMDLEEQDLEENSRLDEFDEWDSLAVISFLSLMDSKFHKSVNIEKLKKAEIVLDLLALMND